MRCVPPYVIRIHQYYWQVQGQWKWLVIASSAIWTTWSSKFLWVTNATVSLHCILVRRKCFNYLDSEHIILAQQINDDYNCADVLLQQTLLNANLICLLGSNNTHFYSTPKTTQNWQITPILYLQIAKDQIIHLKF